MRSANFFTSNDFITKNASPSKVGGESMSHDVNKISIGTANGSNFLAARMSSASFVVYGTLGFLSKHGKANSRTMTWRQLSLLKSFWDSTSESQRFRLLHNELKRSHRSLDIEPRARYDAERG